MATFPPTYPAPPYPPPYGRYADDLPYPPSLPNPIPPAPPRPPSPYDVDGYLGTTNLITDANLLQA
jgi:hypothetical protein